MCFGKSVFCRKNRDAPIVLNVTVWIHGDCADAFMVGPHDRVGFKRSVTKERGSSHISLFLEQWMWNNEISRPSSLWWRKTLNCIWVQGKAQALSGSENSDRLGEEIPKDRSLRKKARGSSRTRLGYKYRWKTPHPLLLTSSWHIFSSLSHSQNPPS